MESQTTEQPVNGRHVSYQFLVEQSQSIQRLHETLQSNIVAYGLQVFLSVLFQIACYLIFVFAIYLAIMIPTDLPSLLDMMGEGNRVIDISLTIPALTDFLLGVKVILALVSLPVLICAFLLGRNRRRARRMRRAFEELEVLKRSHDQMLNTIK